MSNPAADPDLPTVQIDIVSDVMCPWCIIGYRQLEQALGMVGAGAYIRWHPFELNPDMPPGGQNLSEHIAEKYGSTPEQSAQTRKMMTDLGASLGITFNYSDESRIVNTFAAHRLLTWAQKYGLQHPLKLALFEAHFTKDLDLSDSEVLVQVAHSVGLDRLAATEMLASGEMVQETREAQEFWTSKGISGVPSIVFGAKYLMTGAQGADAYADMLRRVLAEKDAA